MVGGRAHSDLHAEDKEEVFYLERKEQGGGYEEVPFLENARLAKLSPNGHYLAYQSDDSGRSEIYIRSFPEGKGPRRVSENGGENVRWRRDGKEVFYVEGHTLMSVSVSTIPTLTIGSPIRLFSSETFGSWSSYDVTADGRRFVVKERLAGSAGPRIRVVLNWFEEFRERKRD